jgi:alpha,alpha-trehalose phosphorylase
VSSEGIALRTVVTSEDFDAVLFDLDGVLVTTRAMHAAAWKPEGEPDSSPEEESVWGVANRKQLLVEEELERAGVEGARRLGVSPGRARW